MEFLWRAPNAKLFHHPVDPEMYGIVDYFDVVKHPMDFGTIKNKLETHQYDNAKQFFKDVQLVFDNCLKYNGKDSHIGKKCSVVQSSYKSIYKKLNSDFWLWI